VSGRPRILRHLVVSLMAGVHPVTVTVRGCRWVVVRTLHSATLYSSVSRPSPIDQWTKSLVVDLESPQDSRRDIASNLPVIRGPYPHLMSPRFCLPRLQQRGQGLPWRIVQTTHLTRTHSSISLPSVKFIQCELTKERRVFVLYHAGIGSVSTRPVRMPPMSARQDRSELDDRRYVSHVHPPAWPLASIKRVFFW
jgi:hypothetical protein